MSFSGSIAFVLFRFRPYTSIIEAVAPFEEKYQYELKHLNLLSIPQTGGGMPNRLFSENIGCKDKNSS